MRTLKKSLALVLALVMVLGLGVVGASADNKLDDYNDLAKLDAQYVEAAGVLTGLGIVAGIDSVTLDPDGYYTREQAAKIITYLLLGETKAEALSCTEDPFDDVAADHWSAKYIAYCAERGIIDGVGGNKFDPYSKLTGYQWAKMLLSAVGFGKNGEFTGDSWSLGTATYAAITDLFEGDETGGDHVALRREQAMLYAFNALNNLGYVTYSEALGDYFWNYSRWTIGNRVLPEGSLGWVVWRLASDTGIIVHNEGTGYPVTLLSNDYTDTAVAAYDADTGLDMYMHAARVWYVDDNVRLNNAYTSVDTAVYVMDLATVETMNCPTEAAIQAKVATVDKTKYSWEPATVLGSGAKDYEFYFINNTAYNNTFTGIRARHALDTLGVRSAVKDTTVIGTVAVPNSLIMTDISGIDQRDPIIVLKAEHAYYVYPLSATTGTVKSVAGDEGTAGAITLTDGTVLTVSNLADNNIADQVDAIRAILRNPAIDSPNYTFVLDTHGHYMSTTDITYRYVVYFTGATAYSSEHTAWFGEETYVGQFVDVLSGTIMNDVPITAAWQAANDGKAGYFELTDKLYTSAANAPVSVTSNDNAYAGQYVIAAQPGNYAPVAFTATTNTIGGADGAINKVERNVTFNTNEVTIHVARYSGSKLVVDTYAGVDDMLAKYTERFGKTISTVNLTKIIAHVTMSPAGNYVADTLFAWEVGTADGGYLFSAVDKLTAIETTDSYVKYGGLYLNGSTEGGFVVTKGTDVTGFNGVGFYTYKIDDSGDYTLEKVDSVTLNDDTDKYYLQANGDGTYSVMDDTHKSHGVVSESTVIVDTREGAGTEWDTIETIADLLRGNYTRYEDVLLTITFIDDVASPIYVIDAE